MNGYHYTECGLPSIYLANGFKTIKTNYGEATSVVDIEGLHALIGQHIALHKKKITSTEIRFLRKEMGLPQVRLAELLGVGETSVRNWENSTRVNISKPAEKLLRALYLEFVQKESSVREMIEKVNQLDRQSRSSVYLRVVNGRWREDDCIAA